MRLSGRTHSVRRSFFQQLLVAVDFCHAMDIALTDVRPESIMLVEANDAPSLCSIGSHHGEGFVTPVGGLGRRGVPRLKLFSFRLGGGAQPATAGRADAYTAPEVRFESLGKPFELLSARESGPIIYLAVSSGCGSIYSSMEFDCRAVKVGCLSGCGPPRLQAAFEG